MATYTGADKRLQYLFEHGGGGGGSANIWTGTMAEYLAQASQIADGTQINITDDEIQSLVVASHDIYSTEEREVGVWIDGKPVYQKTVYVSALPSARGYATYSASVTNAEKCWLKNAVAGSGDLDTLRVDFTNYSDFETASLSARSAVVDGDVKITVYVGRDRSTLNAYFTVQYTKTTDAAGSGLFVPSGAGAVHYTTAEQIIGTYLGNTLYQKTWNNLSVSVTAGEWIDTVPSASLNEIISAFGTLTYTGNKYMANFDTRLVESGSYVKVISRNVSNIQTLISLTLQYTKTA